MLIPTIQSERKFLPECPKWEQELVETTIFLWVSETEECQIHSLQRSSWLLLKEAVVLYEGKRYVYVVHTDKDMVE